MNYEEIVNELNLDLCEKYGEVEHNFIYLTNGFTGTIKFDGFVLWNSEDDERNYDEQKNEYEDMSLFIKRMFNEFADEIQKLKF